MPFQNKIFILTAISFLVCHSIFCQRDILFHAEASGVLGSSETPFWMRANKFGIVPIKGQTLSTFVGMDSDYDKSNKEITWGYGLNLGLFLGAQNKLIIQEGYLKAKWKVFEMYAGRRKEIQGLVDTSLSSGSYIWSGNALPIPKVQVSIPEYTVIGPSGIFSIKGNYAHGFFENSRNDAKKAFLHQKSFYARIGKPNYKFKFYFGLNHQVQWGGISKFTDTTAKISVGTAFGSSVKDYLAVITGKSQVLDNNSSTTLGNDKNNRIGNHLGTADFAFEIKLKKTDLFIYRQSIYEDGSLFYLNNITDGLNGLSIKFNEKTSNTININKVCIEFLNTLSQGGPFFDEPKLPGVRGNDNYFNNTIFRDGWSYKKTSIGTPFILGQSENIIKKNIKDLLFFNSNRTQVYYFGLDGQLLDKIGFISKISFSKNWGTTTYPQKLNQTSFFINLNTDIETRIGAVNTYVSLAADFGELLNKNIALQFGFKKSWAGNSISDFLKFQGHATHKHFNR